MQTVNPNTYVVMCQCGTYRDARTDCRMCHSAPLTAGMKRATYAVAQWRRVNNRADASAAAASAAKPLAVRQHTAAYAHCYTASHRAPAYLIVDCGTDGASRYAPQARTLTPLYSAFAAMVLAMCQRLRRWHWYTD